MIIVSKGTMLILKKPNLSTHCPQQFDDNITEQNSGNVTLTIVKVSYQRATKFFNIIMTANKENFYSKFMPQLN